MDRCHLRLIVGGREPSVQAQEAEASRRLYPVEARVVRAEPRQDPTPPRAA